MESQARNVEMHAVLAEVTGLIMDLVRIVWDYQLGLAHKWAPVPVHLRDPRPLTCVCPIFPDFEFRQCLCWKYRFQHACSVYTIGDSGATGWRMRIIAPRGWWTGITWISPEMMSLDVDYSDSLAVPNGQSLFLSHCGKIYRFRNQQYIPIQQALKCDHSTQFIDFRIQLPSSLLFIADNGDTQIIALENDECLMNARPFIQLSRNYTTEFNQSATIKTFF